jgi:addiction module HigA family antidote
MRMKNPLFPGELIGDGLEELGVSVSEAARVLGITRQQLHSLIAGRSAVKPEMAIMLELALGSPRGRLASDAGEPRSGADEAAGIFHRCEAD